MTTTTFKTKGRRAALADISCGGTANNTCPGGDAHACATSLWIQCGCSCRKTVAQTFEGTWSMDIYKLLSPAAPWKETHSLLYVSTREAVLDDDGCTLLSWQKKKKKSFIFIERHLGAKWVARRTVETWIVLVRGCCTVSRETAIDQNVLRSQSMAEGLERRSHCQWLLSWGTKRCCPPMLTSCVQMQRMKSFRFWQHTKLATTSLVVNDPLVAQNPPSSLWDKHFHGGYASTPLKFWRWNSSIG